MEAHYGVHLDGDWDFLGKIFSTEEIDFAQQCLGQIPNESGQANIYTYIIDEDALPSLHNLDNSLQYKSQDSGNSSVLIPTIDHESCGPFIPDQVLVSEDINSLLMDINMIHPEKICAAFPNGIKENYDVNAGQEMQLKRKFDVSMPELAEGNHASTGPFGSAKKPRVSINKLSPKGKCEEENSGDHSNSFGEDNASQELNGVAISGSKASAALKSNGKTRASRRSATDPQSLYARKRRERINERLRILQGLIPNGTKVDISTMLEEAVHYIKCLQHQIKLLSSDDMWMYAPIVYSGMDFSFNQKISSS